MCGVQGGEPAALARLKYYLWDSDCVATYFDTRNGMVGGDYSTKFSPWLANGCISPRTIYHELQRYEAKRTANKSTYWVVFELLWRDYFKFFCVKHGARIFLEGGIIDKQLPWTSDEEVRPTRGEKVRVVEGMVFARWRLCCPLCSVAVDGNRCTDRGGI